MYLTPASLGYLTQFILALMITAYFVARLVTPRVASPLHMRLLAGFFACIALLAFLFFMEASLPPSYRLYALFLQNTVLGMGIVLLLQFAYRFPATVGARWEALLVLGLSLVYTAYEAVYAVYRFWLLSTLGQVIFRPPGADYPMSAGLLWAAVLFARQWLSAAAAASAGSGWSWRFLWQPPDQAARTARALMLVYLLPFGVSMLTILKSYYFISATLYQLSLSMGVMIALASFVVVYLNYLPETTSFMVKLVGATLVALLAVLGAVGWVITPLYAHQYRPVFPDHQTLRFTPNAIGGYDITLVPFRFESDLGVQLDIRDATEKFQEQKTSAGLDFDFPFYARSYSRVYVTNDGTISLGETAFYRDYLYYYGGKIPSILPVLTDLKPEASQGGGIFARQDAERLIITWSRVPSFRQPQAVFTFQVVLYHNGVFEITYNGLPRFMNYSADSEPWDSVWVVGSLPGNLASWPQRANLSALTPGQVLSGGPQGLVQDYYLDFRDHLHALLLPLAYLMGVASLAVVIIFPFLFYLNLVRPLNALMRGVRRMNQGQLDVTVPPQFPDEIGFLTQSFNQMSAELAALVAGLEARVAERTQSLQQSNEQLQILHEIDQFIIGAQSPASIAHAILGRVFRVVPCCRVSVVEFDAAGGVEVLAVEAVQGFTPDISDWVTLLYAAASKQTFTQGVADLSALAEHSPLQARLYEAGVRAYLIAPLLSQLQLIGCVTVESDRPNVFTARHIDTVAQIAAMLSIAIRQAQLLESLRQRTAELEARNAELDAFAHTVAHDLKTPLSVIAVSADLLTLHNYTMKADKAQGMAQMMSKNAYKAAAIVDNLLLLASAQRQAIEPRLLDMAVIVNEVLERLSSLRETYHPQVITPPTWPAVLGYAPWVEEVWVNYVSNAFKYGAVEGEPLVVELGWDSPATFPVSTFRFWVRDRGRGLTAEEQARLFIPFERLGQTGIKGHGLGLSIVRRIVERLGGQVGVESVMGQGSLFYFTLPAAPQDASA